MKILCQTYAAKPMSSDEESCGDSGTDADSEGDEDQSQADLGMVVASLRHRSLHTITHAWDMGLKILLFPQLLIYRKHCSDQVLDKIPVTI